jgi:hypothetical protein
VAFEIHQTTANRWSSAMTLIENQTAPLGLESFWSPRRWACVPPRKIKQSITLSAAHASAQAKFTAWIGPAMSNAPLRSAKRIESCENAVIETHQHAVDFKEP